jgi:cytochrome c oxidase subunit II
MFGALALSSTVARAAEPLMGQPTPGGIGFQPAGDEIKRQVIFFHNDILMPIITVICLLVLFLIVYICIRFNKRANPTPARFTHNTQVEIIWTVAPVLILMFIAIFSFRLLYAYHDMPKPDLTVKATGNQWYWNYTYPDHGGFNFDSLILAEDKAKAAGKPYRLGVDNPLVVPTGKVVRVLVTGADVIHDFAMPAFGLKTDAVPGKVNETWFKADKPGIYYGQCSELCGVDHAFMPIEIDVVSQDQFNAWIVKKGGKLPGAPATAPAGGPAAAPGAAPASPQTQPAPGAPAGAAPATGAQPGQTAKTGPAPAAKTAA